MPLMPTCTSCWIDPALPASVKMDLVELMTAMPSLTPATPLDE
ncbi:hypothetical protein BJQ94_17130 [Cryobacterium sp. SO2]|nr:hypothetical protein [Cryobacterium sp. SO2]WEO77053.1 hypothetical protein BJQ94_17130 [Cryobacterium sp. SO2]